MNKSAIRIIPLFFSALVYGCGCSVSGEMNDTGAADAGVKDGGSDAGKPDASSKDEFIGTDGGSVTLLNFGAFSDSQPPDNNEDDLFPSNVVRGIMTQMTLKKVQFVVGAGDWMFADSSSHVGAQLAALVEAEKPYTHMIFHAMGNHECKTATDSNCPLENESPMVTAYRQTLLPFEEHSWFSFYVVTSKGTAKFIFTSTNAWDPAVQGAWLESEMQKPAAYTFIIQHAADWQSGADTPGATAALEIIDKYGGATLFIHGHAHLYKHLSDNKLIIGNGGAMDFGEPPPFFGFAQIRQLQEGNILVTVYDDSGNQKDQWAVTPAGKAAQ